MSGTRLSKPVRKTGENSRKRAADVEERADSSIVASYQCPESLACWEFWSARTLLGARLRTATHHVEPQVGNKRLGAFVLQAKCHENDQMLYMQIESTSRYNFRLEVQTSS